MHWLFYLLLPIALFSECFYFIPPAGWQCVEPKQGSSYIHIGFIGQGTHGFCPSINLATEEVDVSFKEYVKAVKEIHLSQPDVQCRDLGSFAMRGGKGHLFELSHPSPWGPVQKFQALLVRENAAYILTAAVLREELPTYRKEILQALKSLTFAQDVASALPNATDQKQLREALISQDAEASQKIIAQWSNAMGAHWQLLAQKEIHAKVSP